MPNKKKRPPKMWYPLHMQYMKSLLLLNRCWQGKSCTRLQLHLSRFRQRSWYTWLHHLPLNRFPPYKRYMRHSRECSLAGTWQPYKPSVLCCQLRSSRS